MRYLFIVLFLISTPANVVNASVWYVRENGGTSTECTGLADADYDGSGSGEACAFEHPSWALGSCASNYLFCSTAIMSAGDTLISTGEYEIGYGMPNASIACGTFDYGSCNLAKPPSGASAGAKTKIYGAGYDSGCSSPSEWWASNGIVWLVNLEDVDNVDIQCLELTDHVDGFGSTYGIVAADSANINLENLYIHGLNVARLNQIFRVPGLKISGVGPEFLVR